MTMPLIESDQKPETNRFPIVWQLVVLFVILGGAFGSLWYFQSTTTQNIQETIEPPYTQITDETEAATPKKLTDVVLRADAAYVWDVAGQRALYKKNEGDTLPLASITKLMTALLAHELVTDKTQVDVPLAAIQQSGNSGLLAGEKLTAERLSQLALISSSNDAAYALGANVGSLLGDRDPAKQFIEGMNIRANELQLPTLSFKNTTGLDVSITEAGAIGSARDVSFLMEYILVNYPELLAPTTQPAARVYNTAGAYHDVDNTNAIATQIPNLLGSKTGYTDLAGGNLTVAFDLGLNRPIIITVLGSTRDERFTDVLELVAAVQESVKEPLAYE
jgi:D-alanyl-D-alanine carboxypeptidase